MSTNASPSSLLTAPSAGPSLVTLQSLAAAVDALPRTGQELVAGNLDFITRLGEPGAMVDRLRALLADPAALAEVAGRSYHHVNHFDKVVLVDSAAGYRLTLHIWDPPYSAAEVREELVHDHRFSFWSHILTGELRSEYYVPVDAGEGTTYQRFRYLREPASGVEGGRFGEFYQHAGAVNLREAAPTVDPAGHSYYLHNKRIHRVLLPERTLTATVVLRGPRERETSNVYSTVYPEHDVLSRNVTFGAGELAAKLANLAAAMASTRR
ncbi:hypothetical protein JQS43_01480 [Natronosporangium hydrolyticum]|uniref:Uncharacterized protein n=1 Tax=Natronosporangium hydrolyticum TaxID=2811111 RepID=A0A895YLV5_9ACTN|nr:hypothetical protein [Natronosporangium hydrolyticum]QSB15080.1 hypothetical protein JQS43_01480 [Natronosporangium hydrolyticum]